MSAFGGLTLTNRGKILQSKAQTGIALNFTRIAMGDGALGSTSILNLNALINQVKTLDINKLKILSDGKAIIGAGMSNQDIVEGFYYREIGLFATDPDIGEVLYCYGNAGDLAEYIPAGGSDIIEKNIDITTVVGNANNITATIDASSVFATKKELNDFNDGIASQELNKGASLVGINDVDSYFTSANVEDALKELRELNNNLDAHKADLVNGKVPSNQLPNLEVPVTSVNNKTGAVILTKSDIGLGSVDNTADSVKNVLSATKLATPRAINGVNFDGTAPITIADGTKAPTGHASAQSTYGLGTPSNYGHVKTINVLTQASHIDGTALSAYQGKILADMTNGKALKDWIFYKSVTLSTATLVDLGLPTSFSEICILIPWGNTIPQFATDLQEYPMDGSGLFNMSKMPNGSINFMTNTGGYGYCQVGNNPKPYKYAKLKTESTPCVLNIYYKN